MDGINKMDDKLKKLFDYMKANDEVLLMYMDGVYVGMLLAYTPQMKIVFRIDADGGYYSLITKYDEAIVSIINFNNYM